MVVVGLVVLVLVVLVVVVVVVLVVVVVVVPRGCVKVPTPMYMLMMITAAAQPSKP